MAERPWDGAGGAGALEGVGAGQDGRRRRQGGRGQGGRRRHLEPLMTYPCCSKLSISSALRPTSPRRGMRLPDCTYCAIASPSPGRSAPPHVGSWPTSPTLASGVGPTMSGSSSVLAFFSTHTHLSFFTRFLAGGGGGGGGMATGAGAGAGSSAGGAGSSSSLPPFSSGFSPPSSLPSSPLLEEERCFRFLAFFFSLRRFRFARLLLLLLLLLPSLLPPSLSSPPRSAAFLLGLGGSGSRFRSGDREGESAHTPRPTGPFFWSRSAARDFRYSLCLRWRSCCSSSVSSAQRRPSPRGRSDCASSPGRRSSWPSCC